MAKIDELRAACKDHQDRAKEIRDKVGSLVFALGDGFREHIGLEATFASTGDKTPMRYITYYSIDDEGQYEKKAYWSAAAIRWDGYFRFGIGIALDSGPNTYPKLNFQVKFEGTYKGDQFTVTVLGETFKVVATPEGWVGIEQVYEKIVNEFLGYFKNPGAEKGKLGFAIGSKEL